MGSLAQNSKEILCKIIDQESKYPVPFATIKIEGSANGVVADEDGDFRLPIEFKELEKTIIISSIGFETLKLHVSSLKNNTINTIYLRPRVEALGAVFIAGKSKTDSKITTGVQIVREAINRIPVNYPNSPHSYIAYYRDYQLVNDNYYNLNESILENFDAGFKTSKYLYSKNLTALYSYNRNENYYIDSLLSQSVYGDSKIINSDESAKFVSKLKNELEILNGHNPIRNYNTVSFSFVDRFRTDFTSNHDFTLEDIKYIDGIPLYRISFASKNTEASKFKARGNIYISKANYAIYKIEYKMIENAKFKRYQSRGDNLNLETRERLNTLYEINVEYKSVNDKMYVNYMTFNNRFIIKDPNPFKVSAFEFDPKDKAFYITFNKSVDASSIKSNSRFKLYFKEKKLIVEDIELVKPNVIRIKVIDWAAGINAELSTVKSEDFTYKLKRIKDTSGVTINKGSNVLGFQFREFFTQEIFEDKTPSNNLIYVIKTEQLNTGKVNNNAIDSSLYWVNSPLKQSKDVGR